MRHQLCAVLLAIFSANCVLAQELPDAPAAPQGDWLADWPGYVVIPWSFRTPALNDQTAAAYRAQGINAIHVDKLISTAQADWLAKHGFPFYVDHAAGKGILHLRERKEITGRKITGKYEAGDGLICRPRCLRDPKTIAELEATLRQNVTAAARRRAMFYSLDDEISTGNFVGAVETCWCETCRGPFRKFALGLYGGSLEKLNASWGTSFKTADEISPATAGYCVRQAMTLTPDKWNFARWADFRQYMDQTMFETLVRLTKLANEIDPRRPAGFEGGQQPSAYGGYDWSRLSRCVQWIEAYDIGSNNEIVRSLNPAAVRIKTFFSSKNKAVDSHRLWYHFVHGARGVILWPAWGDESWWNEKVQLKPEVAGLPGVFRELTSPRMATLLNKAEFVDDGVAIYYSQPSLRAAWVMDATVHGESWPARSGGIERYNSSTMLGRYAWVAMIEDMGLQYQFVDAAKLAAGELKFPRFKALILPHAHAISDAEAAAIRKFAEAGGLVIADYLPGMMDENCRSRGNVGALDDLFGVKHDFAKGLFDGKHVTFIDGEKYQRPVMERVYEDLPAANNWSIVERGITGRQAEDFGKADFPGQPVYFQSRVGKGWAVLLNLSPWSYTFLRLTDKTGGHEIALRRMLARVGVFPVVSAYEIYGSSVPFEVVRWRKGGRVYLCVIKNPQNVTDEKDLNKTIESMIADKPAGLRVTVRSTAPAEVINERTGKKVEIKVEGEQWKIEEQWVPCEAAIYSFPE